MTPIPPMIQVNLRKLRSIQTKERKAVERKADARDPKVDINNPITKIAEKVVGEDVIKLDGIIMDGSGNYIVMKDV